jgi:hypothetical protein
MDYTWAVAGYQGAISSGQTTCGLLIGCSIAIGLRHGQAREDKPADASEIRQMAIKEVNHLYRDFLNEFGDSECRNLINCHLGKPEDQTRYLEQEIYKDTCVKFFNFVMDRFIKMDQSL